MRMLYAINDEGENVPVANLDEADSAKIGRGFPTGHSFGIVTDQDTGKEFEVFQASCGIGENCNCAVKVKELAK